MFNTAQTVLRGQADALRYISDSYEKDEDSRHQFFKCLECLRESQLAHGKVILAGVGKSHKIADKIASSMISLGVQAMSLHPQDALHGDLGVVRTNDVVVMITASGNTPELKTLSGHIPKEVTTICLTCTPNSPLCKMTNLVLGAYVPDELSEKTLYGIEAPTVTTTACLVVGDALTITLAEMLVADHHQRRQNFGRSHPGGAIGTHFQTTQATTYSGSIEYVESLDAFKDERALLKFLIGKQYLLWDNRWLVHVDRIVDELDNFIAGPEQYLRTQGISIHFMEKVQKEELDKAPKSCFVLWDQGIGRFTAIYNDGN